MALDQFHCMTLSINKSLTFSSFCEVRENSSHSDKKAVPTADRTIMQLLIVTYETGRSVDLDVVLTT